MFKPINHVLLAVLTLAPLSSSVLGQDPGAEVTGATRDQKLQLSGYLTQAYAMSDGNQIQGISEDGSTAFGNLALQLRYQATRSDSFVVQLSRERQGRSPVHAYRDEIEVDWAFYQHQFPTGTYVKLGRVPMPGGIYNEIRDVGTVLPFYSVPVSLYMEGQFANESVDGVVAGHRFFFGSSWALDVDVYGGRWKTYETSFVGADTLVAEADNKDALGTQLWLNTPVSGLRLGVAANRFDVSKGIFRAGASDRWKTAMFSVDGDFERFLVRAELYHREVPLGFTNPPIVIPKLTSDSYYVQVGYRFDSGWSIFGQAERGDVSFDLGFLPPFETSFWEDYGLSLGYAFSPKIFSTTSRVALKLELHRNEGYLVEGVSTSFFGNAPFETTYGLLSVSLSVY